MVELLRDLILSACLVIGVMAAIDTFVKASRGW